ncbi:phosphomannomutase/phosphoglucosamine mutase [Dehalogenimonas sp. WBC-2]|nr:phosphomannomutase/phosphoglucosamine mutase [Dehalogenimonas sp. WBC-2]
MVELAGKIGFIVGERYRNIVVGGDTRISTNTIKQALFNGIQASGSICQDAGLIPTPTLAYAARHFDAGIMITASHNPPQYNGLKFWHSDGAAFDDREEREIEFMVSSFDEPSFKRTGVPQQYHNAVNEHIDRILNGFSGSLENLRVVIDCGGGAGSVITPRLLYKMGIKPVQLYCEPSGVFPRPSEPTDANLTALKQKVIETKARVGLSHDGDADRLVVVTESGDVVSGDKLLIILAQHMMVKKIVTTVDASMVIEESGLTVHRTRVGDSAVSAELKKTQGEFGGEPCGAWIFPKLSYCPDGINAAAIIAVIAGGGQSLSKLAAEIPSYPIIRGSVKYDPTKDMASIENSLMAFDPIGIDRTDGIKLKLNSGWLLVRPSGTEPLMRLTVEAQGEHTAKNIYEKAMALIVK